jgi:hypothetical protein
MFNHPSFISPIANQRQRELVSQAEQSRHRRDALARRRPDRRHRRRP